MHKPEKQSCAYLEGEKNMYYMRFFSLILKQEPLDLP